MKYIDLRSDTVTQPTDEMRQAMVDAIVGDDVYGDDPTVVELERLAASMVGKEAALFVPSGTFGNQLALFTHTNRGDEVILENNCHIKKFEVGAPAVIAGVQLNGIIGHLGKMPLEAIEAAIRDTENIHYPTTSLICLENAAGVGTVLDLEYMKDVRQIADRYSLKIHLDGARVFNAAVALNVDVKDICKEVDSVMFCLSKGLCSPVGSILAGTKEFILKARKNRKLMGGGMRQVGILASCGLVSLNKMTKRLHEDHANATYFADQLETIQGFHVDRERLSINMVFLTLDDDVRLPKDFVQRFLERGIKVGDYRGKELRLVTHHGVTRDDVDHVVATFRELVTHL